MQASAFQISYWSRLYALFPRLGAVGSPELRAQKYWFQGSKMT